jgi:hypothetical protein
MARRGNVRSSGDGGCATIVVFVFLLPLFGWIFLALPVYWTWQEFRLWKLPRYKPLTDSELGAIENLRRDAAKARALRSAAFGKGAAAGRATRQDGLFHARGLGAELNAIIEVQSRAISEAEREEHRICAGNRTVFWERAFQLRKTWFVRGVVISTGGFLLMHPAGAANFGDLGEALNSGSFRGSLEQGSAMGIGFTLLGIGPGLVAWIVARVLTRKGPPEGNDELVAFSRSAPP